MNVKKNNLGITLNKKIILGLVKAACQARNKVLSPASLTFKTAVGAAILTKDGQITIGGNYENKIHKGIHAEVGALYLASFLHGYRGKDFVAIAVVYDNKPGEPPYPACAECRQWLWEGTNPNLIIIAANTKGEILYIDTLKNLYPMPYPSNVFTSSMKLYCS